MADSQAAIVANKKDESAMPSELEALGALRDELVMWLNFDSTEKGGLGWTRGTVRPTASSEVQVGEADGRRWLDFSHKGALVKFEPALQLGTNYTLCSWMLLPPPHGHALLWQGAKGQGAPLYVTPSGLHGWKEPAREPVLYAPLPSGFGGWHHFAVSCDGTTTTVFLDGRKCAAVPQVLSTNVFSTGNHWNRAHQHWMMCAGLDDQFIFHRALDEAEVRAVMNFPTKSPRR